MPICIESKQEGFRRCGVAHPKAKVLHPGDRFTKEELERLVAEPMLIVTEVDEPESESEATEPETDEAPPEKPDAKTRKQKKDRKEEDKD